MAYIPPYSTSSLLITSMASQETKNKPPSTDDVYRQMVEGIVKAKALSPSELPLSPSDTIICSSPKSGTTWLKSLAFAIVARTRFDPFSEHHPLLASVSHDLIPFIEIDIAQNRTPREPGFPLLSTHMPFASLPRPVLDSGCKLVYICRSPKDVFVSYWHFLQKMVPSDQLETVTLERLFDNFCKGERLIYGDYWDHVVGYWKASLGHPEKDLVFEVRGYDERILFLKYEDMMSDAKANVESLAEFMGYPFSEEERRAGVVARIVEMCSFASLSNLEVNTTGKHRDTIRNDVYFRKAKVGDWRNYLTPEMASRLDQITLEKLAGSGLTL